MTGSEPPPQADDDFPEFGEPPRQRPGPSHSAPGEKSDENEGDQGRVDALIERLRREREQGTR